MGKKYHGSIATFGISIQVAETTGGTGWMSEDNRKLRNQPGWASGTMNKTGVSIPGWFSNVAGHKGVQSREHWECWGRKAGFEKTWITQEVTLDVSESGIYECGISQIIIYPYISGCQPNDKAEDPNTYANYHIRIYNKAGKCIYDSGGKSLYSGGSGGFTYVLKEDVYRVSEPIGRITVTGSYYGGHQKYDDWTDYSGWRPDIPIGVYAKSNINELEFINWRTNNEPTRINRTIFKIV
jgi:hypothetical protein